MLIETYLDKTITLKLREKAEEEESNHYPSGKLTASSLGFPLQWQILKSLGVGVKKVDDYLLRKFVRGKSVEDWLVYNIPPKDVVEAQKFVEYRGVIGFADIVLNTESFDHKLGIIPHEIKSVTNAKFKRLVGNKEADPSHKLQNGLYALALGADHYAIDYVATDDLRVLTLIYETKDIKSEIDKIIDEYEAQMAKREVPIFQPRFKWQATKNYNQYPEWQDLTLKECKMALDLYYPDAFQKYYEKIIKKK